MNNIHHLPRGTKVNYDPDAPEPKEEPGSFVAGFIPTPKFPPTNNTYVWALLAHMGIEWYVIEHHDGKDKSFFLAKPPFDDGFESIHSSQLEDGKKYIYANRHQLIPV